MRAPVARPRLGGMLIDGPVTDWQRRVAAALSFGGVAFLLVQLAVGMQAGLFPVPGGDEYIWDRVGDSVRTGVPIYFVAPNPIDSFWYAPPVAVVFATFSWLPLIVQASLMLGLRIISLRVIAGSWLGAGIACWFPLVAFDFGGGNFNLLIAASIVAAAQAQPQLAVWGALAKFGPALAIAPRDWRKVLSMVVIAVLITLPWLHLWPEYAAHLFANIGTPLGPQIPAPMWLRLVAGAVLLMFVRSPWARALAATLAIPAFYWGTLVVLIAPLAVAVRSTLASRQPNRLLAKPREHVIEFN